MLALIHYKDFLRDIHPYTAYLLLVLGIYLNIKLLPSLPVETHELSTEEISEREREIEFALQRDRKVALNIKRYRAEERARRANKRWWEFWI